MKKKTNLKKFGMYLSGFGIASVIFIPGRVGTESSKTIAMFIAVGMILTGMGIQLYYLIHPEKLNNKEAKNDD